jgi:tetratricopeptide (TPR) repeat protein
MSRWSYALVLAFTVLAWRSSLEIGFVFDDHKVVVNNPLIRRPSALPAYVTPEYYRLSGDNVHYRPVSTLSHFAVYQLAGLDPRAHHLANLLLHLLNVALVLALLRRVAGPGVHSLAAAAWFAVHPALAESILCVTFRRDAMVLAFGLLALGALARAARGSPIWIALAALLQAAAMGTKEHAAVYVALLPLTLVLLAEPLGVDARRARRTAWLAAAALALATAAYLAMRFHLASLSPVLPSRYPPPSPLRRVALAVLHLRIYLQLLIVPWPLGIERPSAHLLTVPNLIASVAALAVAAGLAVRAVRALPSRAALTAFAWIVAPLVPVLAFITANTAERYLYVSGAGAALLLALVLAVVAEGLPDRRWLGFAALPALALLGRGLGAQIEAWKNPVLLWRQAHERFAPTYRTHLGLAAELAAKNELAQAEQHLRESMRLYPDSDAGLRGLAHVLRRQGRVAEADAAYHELLRRRPVDEDFVAADHAILLVDGLGLVAEAVADLEKRVAKKRHAAPAIALGKILDACGLRARARRAWEIAAELDPGHEDVRRALTSPPPGPETPEEEALYRKLMAGEKTPCQSPERRADAARILGADGIHQIQPPGR